MFTIAEFLHSRNDRYVKGYINRKNSLHVGTVCLGGWSADTLTKVSFARVSTERSSRRVSCREIMSVCRGSRPPCRKVEGEIMFGDQPTRMWKPTAVSAGRSCHRYRGSRLPCRKVVTGRSCSKRTVVEADRRVARSWAGDHVRRPTDAGRGSRPQCRKVVAGRSRRNPTDAGVVQADRRVARSWPGEEGRGREKVGQLSRPSEGHFARRTGRVTWFPCWLAPVVQRGRTGRRHTRFPHWQNGSTCCGKAVRHGRAGRAVLKRPQKSKLARQRKDRTPLSLDCSVPVDT